MRFDGRWLHCDDAVVRPILFAEILTEVGTWHSLELLVDTGADRTVLSANVWQSLGFEAKASAMQLAGLGGFVQAVAVRTQLRFQREDGSPVLFRGEYAACLDPSALDVSVLGRDILDLFTLIADRKGNVLTLVSGTHSYAIQST